MDVKAGNRGTNALLRHDDSDAPPSAPPALRAPMMSVLILSTL